ncbi:hypothetical protein JG687_00010956, partial [Phytophthora cactorum]
LQDLLVCLPASATNIFQPLDVAVFASFKGTLRVLVNVLVEWRLYSIDKATAPAVKGKKKKTADVIWKILTVAMMENTEQNKTKNARTTTAKTNMDKKKTSAAKPTKSAKLVDPTNTTAVNAVKKVRMYKRRELTTQFAWRHTVPCSDVPAGTRTHAKYNEP